MEAHVNSDVIKIRKIGQQALDAAKVINYAFIER